MNETQSRHFLKREVNKVSSPNFNLKTSSCRLLAFHSKNKLRFSLWYLFFQAAHKFIGEYSRFLAVFSLNCLLCSWFARFCEQITNQPKNFNSLIDIQCYLKLIQITITKYTKYFGKNIHNYV